MAKVKVKVIEGLPLKVAGEKKKEAELEQSVVDAINKKGKSKLEIVKGDK